MACRTEEKIIKLAGEDRRLSVQQLPAMAGVKLFTRLTRLVGPSIALLVKGDETKIGEAVRLMLDQLTETEVEHLIGELLFKTAARVEVRDENGGSKMMLVKDVFAGEFAGELGAIVAAVAFALQVNFGNFLGGLDGLKSRAEAMMAKTGISSPILNTSAGLPKG
jgi:hypothetical protein